MSAPFDWRTKCPPLATIMVASFETLCTWVDNLPPPQTDVERSTYRRLIARRAELAKTELRRQAPDFADKYEQLLDSLTRLARGQEQPD